MNKQLALTIWYFILAKIYEIGKALTMIALVGVGFIIGLGSLAQSCEHYSQHTFAECTTGISKWVFINGMIMQWSMIVIIILMVALVIFGIIFLISDWLKDNWYKAKRKAKRKLRKELTNQ